MRILPALAVLVLAVSGCSGSFLPTQRPPAPPVTTTEADLMVYKASSAGDSATATTLPAGFGGAPRFSTVATGFAGAEPSIGVTAKGANLDAGNVVVSAYEKVVRSSDGGATWQAVYHAGNGQDFDPMLWVDPMTDRVFATHMNPEKTCNTMATSDDSGQTWTTLPLICPATSLAQVDHQKLTTGPFAGPQGAVQRNGPYPDLVTLCYNDRGSTLCAASSDGGKSFPVATPVDGVPIGGNLLPAPVQDGLGRCGGLNGHQHHAADGTIYVPYGYECKHSRIAVSTDGGTTWTRRAPGPTELELDPSITTTPDGTAYYLYRGDDQRIHLLRSHDRFATTEGPFLVSPPPLTSTVFSGIAAGSDGRIAVAYLGTSQTTAGPDEAGAATQWNLYMGVSLDANSANPTFATARVNPTNDPVQRGSICMTLPCKHDDRNLLDFIDMQRGPDGRPWVAYADGCTSAACHMKGQLDATTSRDDTMSVAWMAAGPSLLTDKGRLALPG